MQSKINLEEAMQIIFTQQELIQMQERTINTIKAQKKQWEREMAHIYKQFDDIIESREEEAPLKHKILMDTRDFDSKPTPEDIRKKGGITETLPQNPIEVTIEELVNYVAKGRTFKCSFQTGTTKDTFVSSSLVAIDVDNGSKVNGKKVKVPDSEYTTIDDFLDACYSKDIIPALVYETFSHTPEWHRFRAVFQLDRVITSIGEMDMIYNTIQEILPGADRAVKSVSLIHGGKEVVLLNPNAVIRADKYIPSNISKVTIENLNNNVANIKEAKRTTVETGKVNRDNIITPALIALYGNRNFESYDELKNHLLSINLADLLRVKNPSKFHCIFHGDKIPSAGIIEVNGHYIYNCLGGCHIGKKDIFNIIAHLRNYKGSEAEKYLKAQKYLTKQLNLKVLDEEWMEAQFKSIRDNRLILTQQRVNKNVYPALAPRMRYVTGLLRVLLDHAEASIMSYPSKDKEGNALFFVSYGQMLALLEPGLNKLELEAKMQTKGRTIKKQIAELTMLGLIKKVSDNEVKKVAPKRYNMALKYKVDNNLHHTVQFYTIPLWTTQLLLEANKIKQESNSKGITLNGITKRAAASINKKVSTKEELNETETTLKHIKTMKAWAKRTVGRKGIFIKEDFMKYAKSKGIGTRYASSILPVVVADLGLNKLILTNADIKKYSLLKNTLRKTAFSI